VMAQLQPAPDAVLHLVKCGCIKSRCSTNRCQCRKAGLNCTDLCSCSDEGVESCDNVDIDGDSDIEYSDNDEDTEEENDD